MKTNAQRQAEYRARKRNAVTPVTVASVTTVTNPVTEAVTVSTTDPSPLVGQASTVSNVSHCLKSVSNGEKGGGEGEGEPLAADSSHVAGEIVKPDAIVKPDQTVRLSKPEKVYAPCSPAPATPAQVTIAADLMRAGAINRDVLAGAGISSYQSLNIGGILHYGPQAWSELLRVWTVARSQRVIDRAQAVVMQEAPAAVSEASGPLGVTRTEKHETTAPMVAAVMAGLQPEVHGKLANGKGGAITVNGNAAIFGAAPVGTLDDWTPAGLTP